MRTKHLLLLLACVLVGQGCVQTIALPPPAPPATQPTVDGGTPPTSTTTPIKQPEVVADGLSVPWDIAFLPAGDLLVTERTGTLTGISRNGTKVAIKGLPNVTSYGEGGLLGILLHPDFSHNSQLYLYRMAPKDKGYACHVERYTLEGDTLTGQQTIMQGIPCAIYHDGGRLAFGPDSKLYITTGDATQDKFAQDTNSLAGKILRVNEDGSIPTDNPFGNAVWSYGHRNPQGITWDDQGRLWAVEHGRSGVLTGFDELNLIEKGKNYGWPTIQGPEKKKDFETPRLQSGSNTTWAPASAAFWDGRVFFGGLRGESLYAADISKEPPVLSQYLKGTFGRIRTVILGPDGMLYLTTSNTDGRGTPKSGDDKVIRLDPRSLK